MSFDPISYLKAKEAKELADNIVDGEVDKGVLRTNIDQKLNDLEEEYAPKLTQVSSQLAETAQEMNELESTKANASDVHQEFDDTRTDYDSKLNDISVHQINKNKGKLDETYMDEEFLQQMAGNTPINAIPADGSLTTEKFADKSVTNDKVNFITKSKNMIGEGNLTAGYKLNSGGGEDKSNANATSDFISIEPNTDYTFTGIVEYAHYDNNKNFINKTAPSSAGTHTMLSPVNASYVKASVPIAQVNTVQMNKGDVLLPFDKFINPTLKKEQVSLDGLVLKKDNVDFMKTPRVMMGKELLNNIGRIYDGKFIETDGYRSSDFIEVSEKETLTFTGVSRLSQYDENKNFVTELSLSASETYTRSTEENVKYLIFSVLVGYLDLAQANKGFYLLPKEKSFRPHINKDLIQLNEKSVTSKELSDELIGEDGILAKEFDVYRNIASAKESEGLPKPQLVITYDDNPNTDYELAFPVHQQHGLPGEVCAITDYLTGRTEQFGSSERSLTIPQLKEMYEAGWGVSTHSKTHRSLGANSLTSVGGGTPKGGKHWYVGNMYRWNHDLSIPFDARVYNLINTEIDEVVRIVGKGTDSEGLDYLISEEGAQFEHRVGGTLFTATDEEKYKEIVGSALELNRMGFNVTSISYPYNASDGATRKIVGKYLRSGRAGTSLKSGFFLDSINEFLPIQNLQSYAEITKWSEEEIDIMLQELVDNNALAMVFEHSWSAGFNPERLDYILGKATELGVEVTTRENALKHHNNRIFIGDVVKPAVYAEPVPNFVINKMGKEFVNVEV